MPYTILLTTLSAWLTSFCTAQLRSQTSGQRVRVCELLGRLIRVTGITRFFLGPFLTPHTWQARAD